MRRLLVMVLCLVSAVGWAGSPRIAVLDFADASGRAEYVALGKGLRSMLTTDLTAMTSVEVVERERLAEIQAELDLGASGRVDPETAAQLGRLSGASHLLSGSYTVVGEQMRLDARLLEVQSGEVVLAEAVDGEREAFFELEKELVGALVGALQLELTPKERAAVGRVHTADFDAFVAFSLGVEHFDEARYSEAIDSLRRAAEADEDFKLARLTLEDYEQILRDMEVRADALEATRAAQERLERLRAVEGEAAVVGRLLEVASREGASARRERLAALYHLAVAYGNIGTRKGKLHRLRAREDRFAMQRSADHFAQRYHAEASGLWPALPLVVDQDDFYRSLPEDAEGFEAWFDEATDHLWDHGADHPENRRHYLLMNLRYPGEMARRLHLDVAEEVRLRADLLERARELGAEDWRETDLLEDLFPRHRAVLELDASTAILRRLAAQTDNEWKVRGYLEEIDRNREYASVLREGGDGLVREWMLLGGASSSWSAAQVVRLGQGGGAEVLEPLQRLRRVKQDEVLLLGELPTWTHQGHLWLSTGPRTDARRASELRYYRPKEGEDPDALVIVEGVPRAGIDLRFDLDFEPAEDWWPRGIPADRPREVVPGRPVVEVLFGVRDVDCAKQADPATDEDVLVRPMRALAVRLEPGRVAVVEVVESERGRWDRKAAFTEQVLGSSTTRERFPARVLIRTERGRVRVELGGTRHLFDVPELPVGFVGFRISGVGYVSLGDLKSSGGR